jgi:DNA mismatch repair protein MutH
MTARGDGFSGCPDVRAPPEDVAALLERAQALVGTSVGALAESYGTGSEMRAFDERVRTKGTAGQLLERALGATGGAHRVVDFEALGVELKTIPIDERGVPTESTHVCTLSLADAETQTWADSWVRSKLARVLFVPLIGEARAAWSSRLVGAPRLWSPTAEQESVLAADFDEIVGLIGAGGIERVTAHLGRWLQVRPKARDGSVRTVAWDRDGEPIETVPRGFYLRPKFTGAILRDAAAMPA